MNSKFDEFVMNHSNGDFFQLEKWAAVKSINSWFSEQITITDENENIVATCSILFRKLFLNYTIAYIPRGYVTDFSNDELNKKMLEKIISTCKKNKAITIDLEVGAFKNSVPSFVNLLNFKNFKLKGREEKDFPYQTQYDMIVFFKDSETDPIDYLSPRAKKFLKQSQKAELFFEHADETKIEIFTKLSDETSRRNGISLRNNDYYKNIYTTFKKDNQIDFFLVGFSSENFQKNTDKTIKAIGKEISGLQKKITKSLDEEKIAIWQQTIKERQDKIENLNKEKMDVIATKQDKIYLAGCFVIYSGTKSYYLYAASSSEFRYMQPNVFMNYMAMNVARERGCLSYNLGGVKHPNDNLFVFKESLGGILEEYEGVYSLTLNPLVNFAFNKALNLRKKLLKLKK